jgi:cyclic lactone autoinducer peptide
MKKRAFMLMAAFGASILTFFATSVSASACFWGSYQPKEPKLFKEK